MRNPTPSLVMSATLALGGSLSAQPDSKQLAAKLLDRMGIQHGLCVVPPGVESVPRHLTSPGDSSLTGLVRGTNGEYWLGVRGGVLRFQPDGVEPETILIHIKKLRDT